MIWAAVLVGAASTYLLKLAGYLIPERFLVSPTLKRITLLIPVSLLAALLVVQTFSTNDGGLGIDARLVGLGVATIALSLRAPLLVAVLGAAAAAALVRALGWLP
jgi:uncharacterized membrane protein